MRRFLCGMFLSLAVACSAVTGPVPSLSGRWVGHRSLYQFNVTLAQQGQGVTGTGTFTGDLSTGGPDSVQVSGSYMRPLVMLDLTVFVNSSPTPAIHFSGRATGDRLVGVDQGGDSIAFVRP